MAGKEKKLIKKNVLWIVSTTGIPEEVATLKFQDSFIGKERKILPSQTISIYGGKPRDRVDMFYDGLIDAMKIAQERGMAIVVEGAKNTPLMERAKKEGIDVASIKSFGRHRNTREFFKKQGIAPNHFFVAGRYREEHITDTASRLRDIYERRQSCVSILIGRPSMRACAHGKARRSDYYKGFSIATLGTLRKQKTFRPTRFRKDIEYGESSLKLRDVTAKKTRFGLRPNAQRRGKKR